MSQRSHSHIGWVLRQPDVERWIVVKWHPWDGTPAELRSVLVLGDGAKWIWDHVATLFGTERTEIVDWYHASEHIWTRGQSAAQRRYA